MPDPTPQRRGRHDRLGSRKVLVPLAALAVAAPLCVVGVSGAAAAAAAPAAKTIDQKVDALLAKMTVAEKFGQLEMAGPDGPNGTPGPLLLKGVKNGTIGSVLDLVGVANINAAQHAAMQSRLHIPLIFSLDVIHGYQTIFPVPIGEASSWDPAAISKDESVSAKEATADGQKWTFNPMVDIARDPRWGRIVEGAGEDPFLGSAVAAAKIHGYQGPSTASIAAPTKMAATVKHFAAYGAPEGGRDYNTVDMSTQRLFNDYLPPYKAAVDAGAATVMSSFNSLNGVPATANSDLLQTILRKTWDFQGTVVSDYQAVQELVEFGFASNERQAAQLAITAGVTIEMGVQVPSINDTFTKFGPSLVASGKLSIATVNADVRHVLRLKYLAGMFDHPFADTSRYATDELTPTALAQARTTADESLVLLRNQNNALPLSTSTPSIAVVGPLADDKTDQLGSNVPIGQNTVAEANTTTVLVGIRNAVPATTPVTYAQGCDAMCTTTTDFPAAVTAARAAALTVVVLGEPASFSGEASSRSNIDLPGQQEALVEAIAATGKPYVVVLMNGRPLTINWLADNAPGLIEAWQPGTEGGNAVADVLFGKVNPSGKLPATFPRSTGQIPIYYDELGSGRPYDPNNKYTTGYLDLPNSPLYPFGYGLSYTSFAFSKVRTSAASVKAATGKLTVKADITNTGTTTGTDVVQLYTHNRNSGILQPVRQLEGFTRVGLAPGQTKTVTFTLTGQNLGYYDNTGTWVTNAGAFDVWVGDSSMATLHTKFAVR